MKIAQLRVRSFYLTYSCRHRETKAEKAGQWWVGLACIATPGEACNKRPTPLSIYWKESAPIATWPPPAVTSPGGKSFPPSGPYVMLVDVAHDPSGLNSFRLVGTEVVHRYGRELLRPKAPGPGPRPWSSSRSKRNTTLSVERGQPSISGSTTTWMNRGGGHAFPRRLLMPLKPTDGRQSTNMPVTGSRSRSTATGTTPGHPRGQSIPICAPWGQDASGWRPVNPS